MHETAARDIQPVLAELRWALQAHYGARLAALVLYGSQARGDAVDGSDIDLLVVLHDGEQPGDRATAGDLAYEMLLCYAVLPSLLHTSLDRYLHEQSPLMINVRREGLLLTDGEVAHLLRSAGPQPHERRGGMMPEQEALLHKARQSLHWARQMAQEEQYDFAASRAYYAMFYVAQAFLLGKGLSFSKHAGVISGFGQHIAYPGIVPVAFHRHLREAQEARLIGDYATNVAVSEEQVAVLIEYAKAFVEVGERLL